MRRPAIALLASALLAACREDPVPAPAPPPPVAPPAAAAAEAREPVEEAAPLVVFLGDSLTAGLGVAAEEAYPARVERLLAERGLPVRVVNGGISGDTTAGGLERLDWYLERDPDVLVVELGANDGLRGQPLASTEASLRAIVERSLAAGALVVVAGMKLPPNYGPEYVRGFEAIYAEIAGDYPVELVPFLLEGVAAVPELNQADGIHPNARGHEILGRTMADALAPVVSGLRDRG
jgi:acyl-CoA thioesterase-1